MHDKVEIRAILYCFLTIIWIMPGGHLRETEYVKCLVQKVVVVLKQFK